MKTKHILLAYGVLLIMLAVFGIGIPAMASSTNDFLVGLAFLAYASIPLGIFLVGKWLYEKATKEG